MSPIRCRARQHSRFRMMLCGASRTVCSVNEKDLVKKSRELASEFEKLNAYLPIAEKVTSALEELNNQLFQQLLGMVEEKLTIALAREFSTSRSSCGLMRSSSAATRPPSSSGSIAMVKKEDVLRGQGGSVTNILSVGLRMFALTTLDERPAPSFPRLGRARLLASARFGPQAGKNRA